MDKTGSKNVSMLDLILLKFPLDNAAACLIVGHGLELPKNFEFLRCKFFFQVLWQLLEDLFCDWASLAVLCLIVVRHVFDTGCLRPDI